MTGERRNGRIRLLAGALGVLQITVVLFLVIGSFRWVSRFTEQSVGSCAQSVKTLEHRVSRKLLGTQNFDSSASAERALQLLWLARQDLRAFSTSTHEPDVGLLARWAADAPDSDSYLIAACLPSFRNLAQVHGVEVPANGIPMVGHLAARLRQNKNSGQSALDLERLQKGYFDLYLLGKQQASPHTFDGLVEWATKVDSADHRYDAVWAALQLSYSR